MRDARYHERPPRRTRARDERAGRGRARGPDRGGPRRYLHLTVPPALATVQLGFAGNVAGHTASTHSPVEANGGSRMNVTCSGRWFVCTAYAPFLPFVLSFTRPGLLGVVFTPTTVKPFGSVPGFL